MFIADNVMFPDYKDPSLALGSSARKDNFGEGRQKYRMHKPREYKEERGYMREDFT